MEPIFIILIGPRVNFFFFFFFFFCLALNYNALLSIDVHCSNEAKKKIVLAPLLDGGFLCFGGAKIAI